MLLVAGSIALDDLEGPFGSVTGELGGSALYFALAASLIGPVAISAPVGDEDVEQVLALLADRDIDTTRLSVLRAPTYRWSAKQAGGTNVDRGSRDSIYDAWTPAVPQDFGGWAFIGSMRPDRQAEAAEALSGALLLAGDSMRSYVSALPNAVRRLLGPCDWFFSNEEELRALGGDPAAPQDFRERWNLDGLVVKAGPRGSAAWTVRGQEAMPAAQGRPVVDVTGAGDALAGGFLARWLKTGGAADGLADALAHGTACAALAISDIGLQGIAAATPADVEELVASLRWPGQRRGTPLSPVDPACDRLS